MTSARQLKADPDLTLALRIAWAIQDYGLPTRPAPRFDSGKYVDLQGYWQQVAIWATQLLRDNPDLAAMSPEDIQALIDRHRTEVAAAWGIFFNGAPRPAPTDGGAQFDKAVANSSYLSKTSPSTKAANTAALLAGLSLNFSNNEGTSDD